MTYSLSIMPFKSICACMHVKSLQSCPTLCDPMDGSPPGSSVHGIFQARGLEWVACPSPGNLPTQGSNSHLPVSPASQEDSLCTEPPGKPICVYTHYTHTHTHTHTHIFSIHSSASGHLDCFHTLAIINIASVNI